jgi:hypothetical protein
MTTVCSSARAVLSRPGRLLGVADQRRSMGRLRRPGAAAHLAETPPPALGDVGIRLPPPRGLFARAERGPAAGTSPASDRNASSNVPAARVAPHAIDPRGDISGK